MYLCIVAFKKKIIQIFSDISVVLQQTRKKRADSSQGLILRSTLKVLFSGFPATKQDVGLFLRTVSFPEHETIQICNLWSASDVSVGSLINSLECNYVWKRSFSPFSVNSSEEPASFPTGSLIDLWGVCRLLLPLLQTVMFTNRLLFVK